MPEGEKFRRKEGSRARAGTAGQERHGTEAPNLRKEPRRISQTQTELSPKNNEIAYER